jgi:hypothetical protein
MVAQDSGLNPEKGNALNKSRQEYLRQPVVDEADFFFFGVVLIPSSIPRGAAKNSLTSAQANIQLCGFDAIHAVPQYLSRVYRLWIN